MFFTCHNLINMAIQLANALQVVNIQKMEIILPATHMGLKNAAIERILLALIPGILLSSCHMDHDGNVITVEISDFRDRDLSTISISTKEIPLDKGDFMIAPVQSMDFSDSVCYILDRKGMIIRYPLSGDDRPLIVDRHGSGPGEYVMPMSLQVYRDTLYLLDYPTAKILKYDMDLNHIGDISLKIPSRNFHVSRHGIFTENNDIRSIPCRIILYDHTGNSELNMVDVDGEQTNDEYIITDMDFRTYRDTTYALDGKGNRLLYFDGKGMTDLMAFEFNGAATPADKGITHDSMMETAVTTHCFPAGNGKLLSFLSEGIRYYSYIDAQGNAIVSGKISDTDDGYPFYPRWSYGKTPVGYMEGESDDSNGSLLFYSLK